MTTFKKKHVLLHSYVNNGSQLDRHNKQALKACYGRFSEHTDFVLCIGSFGTTYVITNNGFVL